jgi:hypothetical protein
VPEIRAWADIFVIAAAAATVLSVLSAAVLARRLAGAVLHDRGRRRIRRGLWKASCLLASLLPTAFVVLVLAVLVLATVTADDLPAGGVGLVLAVAVGVVGNHVDRQVSTGWTYYWDKIHDSLRAAMPVVDRTTSGYPDCQRTRYNVTKRLLHDRDGQQDALNNILICRPCTGSRPCPGHGGPADPVPASLLAPDSAPHMSTEPVADEPVDRTPPPST